MTKKKRKKGIQIFDKTIRNFEKLVPVRFEPRVDRSILDDVCLDCMDFLKHPCVECEDCPVRRLKGV
jgi:hypothetical protein